MRTMSACCLTISLKSAEPVMVGGTGGPRNFEAADLSFEYTGGRLLWRSSGRRAYSVDYRGKRVLFAPHPFIVMLSGRRAVACDRSSAVEAPLASSHSFIDGYHSPLKSSHRGFIEL